MGEYGVSKIFAQEKNITTYNLARMNMLLHGVKDNEFNISHGDSLTNEWGILSEENPHLIQHDENIVLPLPCIDKYPQFYQYVCRPNDFAVCLW
jgi:type I restriction enzyme M protein